MERAAASAIPVSRNEPRLAKEAASRSSANATARSGQRSQELARAERQAPKNTAAAASNRDSSVTSRPVKTRKTALTATASEAARPKEPVRSAWSAIRPAINAPASVSQVGVALRLRLSHDGPGTAPEATGGQDAPSHLHLPSADT